MILKVPCRLRFEQLFFDIMVLFYSASIFLLELNFTFVYW